MEEGDEMSDTQRIAYVINQIAKGVCPWCPYPLTDLPDPACPCKELHYQTRKIAAERTS